MLLIKNTLSKMYAKAVAPRKIGNFIYGNTAVRIYKAYIFLILIIVPLFSKANALRKIRNFIDSNTAMRTYKAYILCHFKRVFFCRVIQYPIEWNELIYYML